jgi:hypothetical protein
MKVKKPLHKNKRNVSDPTPRRNVHVESKIYKYSTYSQNELFIVG